MTGTETKIQWTKAWEAVGKCKRRNFFIQVFEVLNMLQMNYRLQECDLLNIQPSFLPEFIWRVSMFKSLAFYLILQVDLQLKVFVLMYFFSWMKLWLLISKFDGNLSYLGIFEIVEQSSKHRIRGKNEINLRSWWRVEEVLWCLSQKMKRKNKWCHPLSFGVCPSL